MVEPDDPAMSVAMTTFNGMRFLPAQLDSILTQTVAPAEIVIADDGSTDGTGEFIARLIRESLIPIRLIADDHVGLLKNVQRVLSACHGEVIVLADQDDLWHPDKLASIGSAMTDPAVWLWFSDANLVDAAGTAIGPQTLWDLVHWTEQGGHGFRDGRAVRRLLVGGTVTGATMAVRRDLLSIALPFPALIDSTDTYYLHDGWLAVLGALLGGAYAERRTLTSYRLHPAQYTATNRPAPDTPARRDRAARQLASDFQRVRLVYDRLVERDALTLVEPADLAVLQEAHTLLSTRVADPSFSRAVSILRLTALGAYRRNARGIVTALADLAGLR